MNINQYHFMNDYRYNKLSGDDDDIQKQTSRTYLEENCLALIEQFGGLEDTKKQTEEICLANVKQNGNVFQNIREQTEEICLATIKQQPYIKQTEKICLANVK